jgi:hypothetical protein
VLHYVLFQAKVREGHALHILLLINCKIKHIKLYR